MAEAMSSDEIKQIRAALRLTQPEFADAVGVAVSTVRTWEQGTRNPGADNIAFMRRLACGPQPSLGKLLESVMLAARDADEAYRTLSLHIGPSDVRTLEAQRIREELAALVQNARDVTFAG